MFDFSSVNVFMISYYDTNFIENFLRESVFFFKFSKKSKWCETKIGIFLAPFWTGKCFFFFFFCIFCLTMVFFVCLFCFVLLVFCLFVFVFVLFCFVLFFCLPLLFSQNYRLKGCGMVHGLFLFPLVLG